MYRRLEDKGLYQINYYTYRITHSKIIQYIIGITESFYFQIDTHVESRRRSCW